MLARLRRLGARLSAWRRAEALDRDFAQELDAHVAMLTDDYIARGMEPADARRAALVRIGGARSIEHQHREARGLPAVEALVQDSRFALRLMRREPWFSTAAIIVLALGIGANTVGFTIVNAAFLRALPFERADRLYMVTWLNDSGRRSDVSWPDFEDWRAHSRTFAVLAAYRDGTTNISDAHAFAEPARATWVTANTFSVLRQQPLLGRDFAPGDDRRGAAPVAIISSSTWRNRYGADVGVLGRTLRVDGQPVTIVGVMPDGMRFPDRTDVWLPFVPTDAHGRRDARVLSVFGRLHDDASRAAAQAELSALADRLRAAYPDSTKALTGVRVETFTEAAIGGGARPMLLMVMGAVVFVLLIACANVASLLLSRSGYRAREIAVRTAVGATRWRIVRQLLIESVLLAVLGGTLALPMAVVGVASFEAAVRNAGFPFWVVFSLDYVVFAYVAALCGVAAVLFGLAPALHVSKTNTNDVLKEGGRGSVGSRRVRRFGGAMVVVEVALTVVLLAGAGLMIHSFVTLYRVDPGIDIDNLTTMRLELPASKYPTADARRAFFDHLEPLIGAVPGVQAVTVTTGVPPLDGGERLLEIEARENTRPVFVGTVTISPTFFDVVGVPLVRGRGFQNLDGAPGAETVIVNDRLANQFFAGENPIGRRLRFTRRNQAPDQPVDVWRTVIGISPSIRHGSPQDAYLNAVVYLPYRQEAPASASLLIRSALAPAAAMDAVRREVRAIDADQPIYSIQTVAQVMAEQRWWYRTWGGVLTIFAVIALILSSMGIYAVMAYTVEQRTQEIGVRLAVGAQRWQVSWLVLERGLAQLAIGVPLGLLGAFVLTKALARAFGALSPDGPGTFVVVALVLLCVTVAACLVPARRATRVDPTLALRAE
jgi:predicted permease